MARNFSPRRKRNKTISSPQQRIISQYFTPRSGISKEEVNFLVTPSPASCDQKTRHSSGADGCTAQITFTPAFGFTTAAEIHQQAEKWCSGTQNQEILSLQHNSGSTTCKSAVCEHTLRICSPLKSSSIERQQTHIIDTQTRVANLMASSTSSGSSTPTSDSSSSSSTSLRNVTNTRTRRSSSRAQNKSKGRPAKMQKAAPETITLESDDEKSSSEDDCCVIVNVVRDRRAKSDSETEESTSCSQSSSTETASQSSQASEKESSSQSSCTSESDHRNTVSFCKKSSSSSLKSARPTKMQTSAKSTFGLVGGDVSDSDDDDDDDDLQSLSQCVSDFAELPVEIMENIFCQLPIVDLMLNCALVCRQWYDIITRDSVMTLIYLILIQKISIPLPQKVFWLGPIPVLSFHNFGFETPHPPPPQNFH